MAYVLLNKYENYAHQRSRFRPLFTLDSCKCMLIECLYEYNTVNLEISRESYFPE